MPVDDSLLDILVCPGCGESVQVRDDESGLECAGCGRVYPIRDGIPVMLLDEAGDPPQPDGGA